MKPFLTRDPEGLRQWQEALEQQAGALPPAPGYVEDVAPRAATPVPRAPAISVQFDGLANADNIALTSSSVVPPDPILGVGPSHIFQMVNIVGRITDKLGTPLSSFDLASFFEVDAGFNETDPRVIYDAVSARWFAAILQFSTTSSSLILAVSLSSDPTGLFCRYRIGNPTTETFTQDFPMLGVSDDKVVLSYNGFTPAGSFLGSGYYVLNKADLTACAASVRRTRVVPDPTRFTPYPAQSLGSTSDLFLAMHASTPTLTLLTVSGIPGVGAVTETAVPLGIRAWTPPPAAEQAGSGVLLDAGDERVLSVAWQNQSLWLAGNEACTPSGDVMARSCLRLIEVLTSGPSIRQDMTFGAAGAHSYYPALQPDSMGNVHIVFTRSSATAFAGVWTTGRLVTDPLNTLQASAEIRPGGGAQTAPSGRMGDYSGAAVDPSDPQTVWVSGEYIRSTASANWGTWLAQLSFPVPPSFTLTVTKAGTGSGTVTSSPAGIDCGPTCSASLASGTVVTLTAAPDGGSVFAGWSGGGCSGTGGCVVTVTADTIVAATFDLPPRRLTIIRSGNGSGTVTSTNVTGIDCGLDCSEMYPLGTQVTLLAAPDAGSVFAGWSGGGCSGTGNCTITVTAMTTVTAVFNLQNSQFTLTVAKVGTGSGTVTSTNVAGIDCGADCSEVYTTGTLVTLVAAPASGSAFAGWSGGGCSGTGSCMVTVIANTTVTAIFSLPSPPPPPPPPPPPQVTLTVASTGTGSGTVTGSGINCGSDCSESYSSGTTVTLSASAAAGSLFASWSGGGCAGNGSCAVTLTANTTVTATFNREMFTLTVTKAGMGSGTVASSPAGIDCGPTCSASLVSGTVVTLTAAPAEGSVFAGWSGGGCSGTGACTLTLSVDTAVTTTFDAATVTLFAAVLPGSRSVQVGTSATAFATIINAGASRAENCAVTPTTNLPATFSFQSTDFASNQLTGTPNTPVAIPAGGAQSFVFALTPGNLIAPTDVVFNFDCANTGPAATVVGVNTLLLSAAATPVPDIIAQAATPTNDGIVNVPGPTGTGVFAVAAANVGAGAAITVTADSGSAILPLMAWLCETDPATGACLSPLAVSVATTINAQATPTFGVFVTGNGVIPFAPATTRIFVRFRDAGGAVRGATSVAVRTQ